MKKYLRIPAIILLAIILIAGWTAARPSSDSGSAYNIPRMLGMEASGQGFAPTNGEPTTDISGPIVETHPAAISMDVDLRTIPQTGPETRRVPREFGVLPRIASNDGQADPVIQTDGTLAGRPIDTALLAPAPAPIMNFKGLDFNNWGGGWPPDTHGDVGPDHYIQAVNTSVGIYSKTTGARLAGFTIDSFFSAAGASGVCATANNGDPIVLYDQISGRWIITDFAWTDIANGPFYECMAISKTADPISGGWWIYNFVADNNALNDYPKLGIWNDGIYMSVNLFNCGDAACDSYTYDGVKVWALNRDDMISGAPLRSVAFNLGSIYGSLLPSNLKGAAAPANTPNYFMSDGLGYPTSSNMLLWKFSTNWVTPAASTFTGPTTFSVASYTMPTSRVPVKNGEQVDTLGDRLMTQLQYRNIGGVESLWVSRTVVAGSYFGIRWMEVRNMSTTPSVYQQGTYAPADLKYRWMPSLAVDKDGNMAVGYSVASSTQYPSIRYAGRLASDPLGTLGQTETSIIEGTGSQTGGYNRWGDYASMSVDPVDDCTFWFTTEYYETNSYNWQTRIASFKYPSCVGGGGGDPSAAFTSVGVNDGYILESGENTSIGATVNANGSVMLVGDTSVKRQYRSILHFDTSSLPDNATITGITLQIKRHSTTGSPFTVLGNLQVEIINPYFGSSASLVKSDFEAAGATYAGDFSSTLLSGNRYNATLNPAAYPVVNLAGVTQFRLAFSIDDNNNGVSDTLRFYSGNYLTASYRPVLTITYTVP